MVQKSFASACMLLGAVAQAAETRYQRVTYNAADPAHTLAFGSENNHQFEQLIYGYDWDTITTTNADGTSSVSNYGLSLSLNADLSIGWSALSFWFSIDDMNKLVINPSAFAEIASHNSFTVHMGNFQYSILLDIIGYRWTPFDVEFLMDMDYPRDYCYGVSALRDAGDVEMFVQSRINECNYGLWGKYVESPADGSDCWWRRYYPQVPIWKRYFKDSADNKNDVVEWTCSEYEYTREDECADDDYEC